jgi:CheY-like chemotaxis protein
MKTNPVRILIVDDNAINLKLAGYVLRAAGYQIVEASGAEAARLLILHSPPDLILLDIALPGMDGLTFARQLKADPATRNIKIAAFTAFAMKGDEEKARTAGCDGYITKPIDTRKFPEQVAALLGASGQAPERTT